MRKFYFFTRATLAAELSMQGFPVKRVENIYKPERTAWRVDMTPELCRVVEDYYKTIGLPIPQPIKDAQAAYTAQRISEVEK